MKNERNVGVCCTLCLLLFVMLSVGMAQAQKKSKYACTEPNPESLCSAANTCGSATTPCTVQIKKDGQGATVTPSIPDAKKNKVFCVKTGTKMNFEAKSKNTGFVVDFGPSSPFDKEDSIVGGSSKPDSAVAKNAGCYKYSAGACVSGAIYGMCGTQIAEMVITK
jgi:hypothetical protein